MKKKLNKILSSALVLVMVFTAALALFPMKTDAAYVEESTSGEKKLTSAQIKEIVKEAYAYTFDSAEEMLAYELEKEYLCKPVHSADKKYSIYVNR